MRIFKAIAQGASRNSALRIALSWIVLFAFALQSYAIQTHIHGAWQAFDGATVIKVTGGHDKSPATPDSSDCPICQAIAHTGAFFTPAAPLLFLPAWVAHVARPILLYAIAAAVAPHDWLSRAPPRN